MPAGDPPPPDPDTPRWSARPLPPYPFVPGRTPHPHTDPAGHGFTPPEAPPGWDPAEWRRLDAWLHAVDLFNHGYWWECHEALEALWLAAGRTTPEARFVQGLLQLSAACLNRRRGHAAAAARQAERGLARLTAAGPSAMGLDVADLTRQARAWFAGGRSRPPLARLDAPPARGD